MADKVGKIAQLTTNDPPDEIHKAWNENMKRIDIFKMFEKRISILEGKVETLSSQVFPLRRGGKQ